MKNKLFVLVLLCSFGSIKSQIIFCPPGAEWHYNFTFYTINNSVGGYVKSCYNEPIKYVRDSVIGSLTAKVLSHHYFFTGSCNQTTVPITLVKQHGDTVFMRNIATHHKWQILYNFAAISGDSWTDSLYSNSNNLLVYTTSVDSVTSVNVNGFNLKRLHVTSGGFKFQITERIGANFFLFNFFTPSCDGIDYERFLCYKDNGFGLKQFSTYPCDYSNPVGINTITSSQNDIKIFPNPSSEFVTIESEVLTGDEDVILTDLFGRILKKDKLINSKSIDMRDLHQGIFLLTISKEKLVISKSKLIKE